MSLATAFNFWHLAQLKIAVERHNQSEPRVTLATCPPGHQPTEQEVCIWALGLGGWIIFGPKFVEILVIT